MKRREHPFGYCSLPPLFRQGKHEQRVAGDLRLEFRRETVEDPGSLRHPARGDGKVLTAAYAVGHRTARYGSIQDRLPDHLPVLGIERPETPDDVARKDEISPGREDGSVNRR